MLRVPISVKPIPIAAPTKVTVNTAAAAGSQPIAVTTGYSGFLSGLGWGLAAPTVNAGKRISATSGNPDPSGADPGTQLYPLTVPNGAQLVSAKLSNVDGGNPNTDLDLYLYRGATLVAVSGSSGSDEDIIVPLPQGGAYTVAVVGFTTLAGRIGLRPLDLGHQRPVAGRRLQPARDHGHGRQGGDGGRAGDADAQLVGRGRRGALPRSRDLPRVQRADDGEHRRLLGRRGQQERRSGAGAGGGGGGLARRGLARGRPDAGRADVPGDARGGEAAGRPHRRPRRWRR